MKPIFKTFVFMFSAAALCAAPLQAAAQDDPGRLWIHATAGLPGGAGGGVDVVINEKLSVRLAAEFLPKSLVKARFDGVHIPATDGLPEATVDILGRTHAFNGDITLDYVPFVNSSFHLSVGALAGNGVLASGETVNTLPAEYHNVGYVVHRGSEVYAVKTGDDNRFHGVIRRKMRVMPYVAIGFGGPAENPVALMFDLGVGYDGGLGAYADAVSLITGKTESLCLRSDDFGRRADGTYVDRGWLDKVQEEWYFKLFPIARLTLLVKLF